MNTLVVEWMKKGWQTILEQNFKRYNIIIIIIQYIYYYQKCDTIILLFQLSASACFPCLWKRRPRRGRRAPRTNLARIKIHGRKALSPSLTVLFGRQRVLARLTLPYRTVCFQIRVPFRTQIIYIIYIFIL